MGSSTPKYALMAAPSAVHSRRRSSAPPAPRERYPRHSPAAWAGPAQAAGEWRGDLSLGAGGALDRLREWTAEGAAINAYFGVELPIGLSLGVYGEAAETWGQKFEDLQQSTGRVQLDYKQYGLE